MLIHRLHPIFRRFMRPADDEGSTGGGAADYGNDFTPTDDDAAGAEASPLREAAEPTAEEKALITGEDGEGEGEEGEGEEGEDKPKGKGGRIPLSRHEKILAKERERRQELEQQLTQFQRGNEVARVNTDITAAESRVIELEKKYHAALGDGDIDEAQKLMREIRVLDRDISDLKADMKSAAAESRAVERVRYSVALERVEEAYPELNQDHEDYNPELTQDVVDLKATYEGRGLTPTAALQKAVKRLMGTEGRDQKVATEVTPRVNAAEVAAARKKDAVGKVLDATNRQPPGSRNVGLNSDALGGGLNAKDVMRMGHDDFVKLSDDALSKMRGDEV
jgi:hypothetical protein